MWVAMRSRNQRSCEITTTQPGKFNNASSSALKVSISRSLVGSSNNKRLPQNVKVLLGDLGFALLLKVDAFFSADRIREN